MTVDLRLGDCLELMREIPDASIDAVITDPPFGIDFKYESYNDEFESMKIALQKILELYGEKTVAIWQSMKVVSRIHEWCSMEYRMIADINSCPPFRKSSIQWTWEPIVLINPPKKKASIKNKDYLITWKPSWHNAVKSKTHINHPCVRPLESVEQVVQLLTNPGDTVLDPFMGSGTTGVACVKLGRNFIGMEINPDYFAIAQRRIAEAQAQMTMALTT